MSFSIILIFQYEMKFNMQMLFNYAIKVKVGAERNAKINIEWEYFNKNQSFVNYL